jgi:hypothetical protein
MIVFVWNETRCFETFAKHLFLLDFCACPACPVGRNYRTGVKCTAYSSGVRLKP